MDYLEQMFSLEGKVAVVTGGGRGLGRGIAEALLKAGATGILIGSNESLLAATTGSFVEQGLRAVARPCDLASAPDIDCLLDYVAREHGRIDVLVNNAGVTCPHELLDYPDEFWERTLRINLEAPFRLSRGFGRMMKEQGAGSIINITSISAELGFPDNPAYVAAKGALRQLTKSLAVDLGPFGVRVNNIGPGYFRTDMTSGSWSDPPRREQRTGHTILGRWGAPADLAGIVILLASDASSYITGQDFYVDGGWLSKGM